MAGANASAVIVTGEDQGTEWINLPPGFACDTLISGGEATITVQYTKAVGDTVYDGKRINSMDGHGEVLTVASSWFVRLHVLPKDYKKGSINVSIWKV